MERVILTWPWGAHLFGETLFLGVSVRVLPDQISRLGSASPKDFVLTCLMASWAQPWDEGCPPSSLSSAQSLVVN